MDRFSASLRKGAAFFSCLGVMGLAACGGGDGGSAPAPQNAAPRFTSVGSVAVDENTAGTFHTTAAIDPDGDAITFRISGGADANLFSIASNGALAFRSPPDFENPADADGNNVYAVELQVSDGRASASQSLSVEVVNVADAARLARIATGLGQAVAMSPTADGELLIVVDADGQVAEIATASGAVTTVGGIFDDRGGTGVNRVITLVAASDYTDSGDVFVLLVNSASSPGYSDRVYVQRHFRRATAWFYDNGSTSSEVINAGIAARLVATGVRGRDGSVYFLSGDGGEPDRARQDGIVGNILRVYRNPDPYAGASARYFLSETIARGLHAPTGGSFIDDQLLFSDSGETRYDEINRFTWGAGATDFGWPFREGRTQVRSGAPTNLVAPVFVFDRGINGDADEPIVAGAFYEGPIVSLDGRFVFATRDGRFFTVDPANLQAGAQSTREQSREITNEFETDSGTLDHVLSLRAAGGTLFVLDSDGEIYRVELEQI